MVIVRGKRQAEWRWRCFFFCHSGQPAPRRTSSLGWPTRGTCLSRLTPCTLSLSSRRPDERSPHPPHRHPRSPLHPGLPTSTTPANPPDRRPQRSHRRPHSKQPVVQPPPHPLHL